jgi:hypothetical protein
MTRHPFNPGELGCDDVELETLAAELESLSHGTQLPSAGFHERVLAAVDAADPPRRSWLAAMFAPGAGGAWQGAALAVVLVLGITAALLGGGLLDDLRRQPGTQPSVLPSASAEPTITPSPSVGPSVSPSPSPSPSATPTPSPVVTAAPTASDDDDETETPEPSESDNSGPGGGGDDNSGPGGADD